MVFIKEYIIYTYVSGNLPYLTIKKLVIGIKNEKILIQSSSKEENI